MRNIYNEDFFALSDSFQQHQNISNNAIMRDGTRDKIREIRILFGKFLGNLERDQIQQRVEANYIDLVGEGGKLYVLYKLVSVTLGLGYCQ